MEHERKEVISGPRFVISRDDPLFPEAFREVHDPPQRIYVIGDVSALQEGLAVVGARKATPYGLGCARRFAARAAERGIVIISGGARGCDAESHRAALHVGGKTAVFLGGGLDVIYPKEHAGLFQEVVDKGGVLVSEHDWSAPPLPYMFRMRNRLIAGLAKATLIVEAGLPSGTFSTADEALNANRDVLVVPGSITSVQSRGANRLICQGATPIIDDETFDDQLFSIFGLLKQEDARTVGERGLKPKDEALLDALKAALLGGEDLHALAVKVHGTSWTPSNTNVWIMRMLASGHIVRYPGGKYGPKP